MEAITRRHLLGAAAVGTAAVYLPNGSLADAARRATRRRPLAGGGAFAQGVMSGDPTHRAVTLWTRLEQATGTAVRLQVARDGDFRRLVTERVVDADPARDGTVKVRVGGLKPDERYFFRFATRDAASAVGRTRTAPAPDSRRPVSIAVFSCQQYTSGFYGAYRHLLEQDPDIVVCLGDYIYERPFYLQVAGREDTTGANRDGLVRTLDEYRAKYRLYRSDPDLQALHAGAPFMAMWDDHEVEDNYAGAGADEDRPRIAAGHRAFHEYQPALAFAQTGRTYRRFRFGRSAELLLLDERSYREDQPCGDSSFRPCEEAAAPRAFLGRAQMRWLKDRLHTSAADWKVVGNQLMVMPLDVAPGMPVTQDSWEGYQAERTELLAKIRRERIDDVAFVTGDIHTFFAGRVRERGRSGPAVAVEYVCGSSTTPGVDQLLSDQAKENGSPVVPPETPLSALADRLPVVNPHLAYAETRSHGYALVRADRDELRTTFHASRDVTTREGARDVRVLASFLTPRGESVVERA